MALKHYEPIMVTLFRLLDPVLSGGSMYLALHLFGAYKTGMVETSLFVGLLTVIVFTYSGVYRTWRNNSLGMEITLLLKSCFILYALYLSMVYLFLPPKPYSRFGLVVWIVSWPVILLAVRMASRFSLQYFQRTGRKIKTAVIAGSGPIGISLARWVNDNPWSGTKIIGFFEGEGKTEVEGYPVLGSYLDLPDFARKDDVNAVYIAFSMDEAHKTKYLVDALFDSTASVYIVPDVSSYSFMSGRCVQYMNEMPVISVADSPVMGFNLVVKRIEDVVLSSIILILVSPLMLLAAIALKLTSKNSILFKQWRYGIYGEKFYVWKFRTMSVTEDGYQFNQVVTGDARVTRIGRILRKTSIDELPQFFNVLQGKMSIVGPRPHAISMVDEYRKKFEGSMRRHQIRPGITGLAQLYGTRGMITDDELVEERIKYDMQYIKEWSLFLDLKIIFLTLLYLFKKDID